MTMGPLPIKVKFLYASPIDSSKQSHWLNYQLKISISTGQSAKGYSEPLAARLGPTFQHLLHGRATIDAVQPRDLAAIVVGLWEVVKQVCIGARQWPLGHSREETRKKTCGTVMRSCANLLQKQTYRTCIYVCMHSQALSQRPVCLS